MQKSIKTNPSKDNRIQMKTLSNDLIILGKIYEYEKVKHEPLWFSKLVELLDGKLDLITPAKNVMPASKTVSTRTAVSMCEDKLMDLGTIDKKYRMAEGKWTCCYLLDDDAEDFAKTIYENTEH